MHDIMRTEMISADKVNKISSRRSTPLSRNGAGNSASVDLRAGSSSISRIKFASNTIRNEFRANALETRLNNIFKQNENIVKSVKSGFAKEFAQSVVNKQEEPIIISITGESASGKSTLCSLIEEVAQTENLPISFLPADNYFKDISALIKKHGDFDSLRNSGYDLDAPENFQLDLLRKDIMALKAGKDVKIPKYLINGTGISVPEAIEIKNNRVIVIEGMASGFDNLQELTDMAIYVDTSEDVRHERFMKRAMSRNQSEKDAVDHWNYIRQAGRKYVQPLTEKSDIVLNGEADIKDAKRLFEDILSFK